MSRAAALASALETVASLVIVCHDNPDPDCLASAIALETIARDQGVDDVTIGYGGELSHQQNRAFVTMLDIDLEHVDAVDVDDYDCVAFVDHSRPGTTTQLDATVEPDVVVDHHPDGPVDATFVDVRPDVGATATLLVEYLVDLETDVTERLASALLFALHRERLDYVRGPTRREYEAALEVYPAADLEVLDQLYGSAFTPGTLDAIGRAIDTRERRGSSLAASVGVTSETDALPQAADYLLNLEGVDTVLVYGIVDDAIRLSGRSYDPRVHIGRTLEDAYGELGPAGGHHDMAGGHIELGLFADDADDDAALLEFVRTRLTNRFFDALNLEEES
ncbi:DHH family phosphoesterase [Natrarchaeobaculum aegyptiacum]|uniref:Phosphoesterase n=1 Tax=Natrarchaeobaculum aegyptiacum TaxID=745377 RepID=A0A2Z2HUN0_9EURY|nr:bifunctional oligoribonuclease/PAP phosphatase NrnA [Natrarchaeobaculum aegyptiacum]ARS88734.1 phosphoesterase [Natrarchaeobaculum aegyptiacum]